MASKTTLYVIVSRGKIGQPTDVSLSVACQQRGIDYQRLIVEDVSLDSLQEFSFRRGDLLYRTSVTSKSSTIESALIDLNPGVLTAMYGETVIHGPTRQYDEMFKQIAAGLPIIPSLIVDDTWLNRSDESLQAGINKIGGFPVILKVLGMSHGQGVQKHDNLSTLLQEVSKAVGVGAQAIVRQYLADYRHYRIIVIDGEVVAAIEYHKPQDDFRTNAQAIPDVSAINIEDLASDVLNIAVKSVLLSGSVLGGVDILVDTQSNEAYLAEVNIPCNYSRAEGPTDIDISGKLIDALVKKSGF